MPKQGDIAMCYRGNIGLITSDRKVGNVHSHHEGVSKPKWRGIHLTPERFGEPWESINPKVIGNITTMLMEHCMDQIQ